MKGINGTVTPKKVFLEAEQTAKGKVFLDGQVYNYSLEEMEKFFQKKLKKQSPLRVCREFISQANGAFALAFKHKGRLYACNDFLGQKTLWFGQSAEQVIASEPNTVRNFGIDRPQLLRPGHLLTADGKKFSFKKCFGLTDFKKTVPKKTDSETLKNTFLDAVAIRAQGLRKAGVYFSGGVDSALVAAVLKEVVPKTELITVGLKGSSDVEKSQEIAEQLGLKLHLRLLKKEEIAFYTEQVLQALGFFDLLQLQIGVLELVAAETAQKKNLDIVFAGQGSDELFAGYSDFKEVMKVKGLKGVQKECWRKLEECWQRNFLRDDLMARQYGIGLRLPFLDPDFLRQASAVPPQEKITSPADGMRKHVLRKLALELNVPEAAAKRPKKALQYGSGIAKEVNKLVKGRQ